MKNKIKDYFRKKRTTYGLWHGIVDPYAAEICAGAGFDWIVIDAEHAPFDLNSILQHLQASEAHDVGVAARPPDGDSAFIKKLLDIGVRTLIIPMVETAAQARQLVEAIHYPPKGKRGVGAALSRAAQWGREKDYFDWADDEMCLIVQVESLTALENLEAICNVEGVDGVFIGPADLAASMGFPGNSLHDQVRLEIRSALAVIKNQNKIPGILALTDETVQDYADAGAMFIGIGVDLLLLEKATRELAKKFKSG